VRRRRAARDWQPPGASDAEIEAQQHNARVRMAGFDGMDPAMRAATNATGDISRAARLVGKGVTSMDQAELCLWKPGALDTVRPRRSEPPEGGERLTRKRKR
jgi:hypothetical protein